MTELVHFERITLDVNQIQVLDSSTIAAMVTIKKGGPRRNSPWDLRVGSAWFLAFWLSSPHKK